MLRTSWIDGREHADHGSDSYFTIHITVWPLELNRALDVEGRTPTILFGPLRFM